ncbi:MAG TPA: DUF4340 domain-containing protein [Bryobacteraceae bacterium]|nr:DUF4340 domain-containing protein [Bryobacteraceae bacterium]
MRPRGLIIAAALLLVLGGLVWWSNKSKDEGAGKAADPSKPILVAIPQDQVSRIEVKRAAGETTVLERKGAAWEITAPTPLRADQDAVASMVATAASLQSEQIVEEKAVNLGEFGLVPPAVEVTITDKAGKAHKVTFGDETPTGGSFFARASESPRVVTVASFTKQSLDKTAEDLRDKRLLTFDQDKLSRVEVTAKGRAIEFGKNNQNEWQILKPQPLRADTGAVEELVRRLKDARMETATEDDRKKAAASFASGTPVATARVTDASGTQEMTLRADKDKNYWAKTSVTEGVHKTSADLGESLSKGLDGYRNKKLFDFGWSEPSKIDIRDGTATHSWHKAGENWLDGAKKLDASAVNAVIDKMRDLAAASFPQSGFTTPSLEVSVTSNEGKRTEKVQFANTGKAWIGKREGEPALYEPDPNAVEELRKAIGAVTAAKPAVATPKR